MPNTYQLISSYTTPAGGTSSITFSSIPSTFTDLCLKLSVRSSSSNDRRIVFVRFNGQTSGYNDRTLRAFNASVASQTDNGGNNSIAFYDMPAANATTSTFSSLEIYLTNYAGSTNKSASGDGVGETNSTNGAVTAITAGLSNVTSAISSIELFGDGTGNFVQYSTAYLYGVSKS